MRRISCIIIDDEPLALQLLESYVAKTPFLESKGSFTNGSSAFAFIQDNPVELLFCDIQMPNLSGMELSKMLPEGTRIIFTTAFSQYAIEGFKVHALDYLLKPISYDDFLASASHAYRSLRPLRQAQGPEPGPGGTVGEPVEPTTLGQDQEPGQPSGLGRTQPQRSEDGLGRARTAARQEVQQRQEVHSIFVKTEYRLQQIELDKITFIEGLKDYVKIHLEGGADPVLSLMRMKTLEEQLPSGRFARVQKSFIVQLSKIESIERNHIIIGQDRIPIGETYQESLFEALGGTSLLLR